VSQALTANLVHFVRHLRGRGLGVVPATVQEMAAAVEAVGLTQREDVKSAFAAIAVNRPTERAIFDDAFEAFFGLGAATLETMDEDVPQSVVAHSEARRDPAAARGGGGLSR
jgi:uncharacterized protein with von Willebrand factor type A (vWA) domain